MYRYSFAIPIGRVVVAAVTGVLAPKGSAQCSPEWVRWEPPSFPAARDRAGAAVDPRNGFGLLFGGGRNGASSYYSDTWAWQMGAWQQLVGTAPPPRAGTSIAFDRTRGAFVLFGGYGFPASPLGDTWEYSAGVWSLRSTAGPSPRGEHASAYDPVRNSVLVFGGFGNGLRGDTWEWNGSSWQLRSVAGPSARNATAIATDYGRSVIVLFGGFDGAIRGDTWEWNGTAWQQKAASGPAPRNYAALAYDELSARVVLYGGIGASGQRFKDVWAWNGNAWTQLVDSDAGARSGHVMFFDTALSSTVVFGGYRPNSSLADTWLYSYLPVASVPESVTLCPTAVAMISAEIVGASDIRWQYRHITDEAWTDLVDGLNVVTDDFTLLASGSTTASLTLDRAPATWDRGGEVRCVAKNECGSVLTSGTLLIPCRIDFDCSSQVDLDDFGLYVNRFENGTDDADFDRSGFVDTDDFTAFVLAFEQGC